MVRLEFERLKNYLFLLQDSERISNFHLIDLPETLSKDRNCIIVAECETIVENQHIILLIGLDRHFPLSLPMFFLGRPKQLDILAHIDKDGFICFAQKEGILLNRYEPERILKEALLKTISIISTGLRKENSHEIIDEFDAYWRSTKGYYPIPSYVVTNDIAKEILTAKNNTDTKNIYSYIDDCSLNYQKYWSGNKQIIETHRKAIYIPLKPNSLIYPPKPNSMWNIEFIQEFTWNNITKENSQKVKKLINKWKEEELIVYKLPRSAGGETLFGITFRGIKYNHPLKKGCRVDEITSIGFNRYDESYLIPRGGSDIHLTNKRIAIIGCGSIGGYIAADISRSGIHNITLIDPDVFKSDNIFRHYLGNESIGLSKVNALKNDLLSRIPYLNIRSININGIDCFDEGIINPNDFDLIFIAIGDETVSLYFNDFFHKALKPPPVLFTWVEPYGIGGHVLLTNKAFGAGCLECLFTLIPSDADNMLHNRSSFSEQGQSFTKDISGCANRFTPYSSLDSSRTASLAVHLAIDVLRGKETRNSLISWKGSETEFVNAGYKYSKRFALSENELINQINEFTTPNCPVCGMGHK